MKKKYIAPSVLYKNVILDNLVCLSIIGGGEGGSEPEAVPGTDPDRDSDGLVKQENLWDEEW
ncbi:MAG: hypothetical protein KBT39_09675 [Bacteroidales bacterium]|nr:hypothetical protein [Bacteroidales bacterium]